MLRALNERLDENSDSNREEVELSEIQTIWGSGLDDNSER